VSSTSQFPDRRRVPASPLRQSPSQQVPVSGESCCLTRTALPSVMTTLAGSGPPLIDSTPYGRRCLITSLFCPLNLLDFFDMYYRYVFFPTGSVTVEKNAIASGPAWAAGEIFFMCGRTLSRTVAVCVMTGTASTFL